MKPGSLQFWLR